MSNRLFQLPQPENNNAKTLAPAPEGARERDDAIAAVAVATPAAVERDEQARREGRDYAARTKTIRRAGYMRLVQWGLAGVGVTLAFGTGVGLLFAGVVTVTESERKVT